MIPLVRENVLAYSGNVVKMYRWNLVVFEAASEVGEHGSFVVGREIKAVHAGVSRQSD